MFDYKNFDHVFGNVAPFPERIYHQETETYRRSLEGVLFIDRVLKALGITKRKSPSSLTSMLAQDSECHHSQDLPCQDGECPPHAPPARLRSQHDYAPPPLHILLRPPRLRRRAWQRGPHRSLFLLKRRPAEVPDIHEGPMAARSPPIRGRSSPSSVPTEPVPPPPPPTHLFVQY